MFYYVSSVFYALSYVYPTCPIGGWDEPYCGCVCCGKGCVPAAGCGAERGGEH